MHVHVRNKRSRHGVHWYVVQDHLRSVRGLTTKAGTWAASWRYRIYGAALDSAGTAPNFTLRYRWIGREYDAETGLYYLRARYLDPATQRFTQEDPIGYAGGPNLYAYGSGNPTKGRDLTGLQMEWEPYYPILEKEFSVCWSCTNGSPFESFWTASRFGMSVTALEGLLQDAISTLASLTYEQYIGAYNAKIASGEVTALCRHYSCSGGTDALKPDEFRDLKNAIFALANLSGSAWSRSNNALAVFGATGMLASGRVGMSEIMALREGAAAFASGRIGGAGGPFMWLGGNFFGYGDRQPFRLAHEMGHVIFRTADQAYVDQFAASATGQPWWCARTSACGSLVP